MYVCIYMYVYVYIYIYCYIYRYVWDLFETHSCLHPIVTSELRPHQIWKQLSCYIPCSETPNLFVVIKCCKYM